MKRSSILTVVLAAACLLPAEARSRKNLPYVMPEIPANTVAIDTFSYAAGVMQHEQLLNYIQNQLGVDTLYLADFVRGMRDNSISEEEQARAIAYSAGLQIGKQNREQVIAAINKQATGKEDTTFTLLDIYVDGLSDALLGQAKLSREEANALLTRQIEYRTQLYKAENVAYLYEHAKEKGVNVTESGVQYRIVSEGSGAIPTADDKVEVHYEGKLIDGSVFDSSYKRNKASTFTVNQLIKGWQEALQMMPEGSVWEVVVPADLGYADKAQRSIPAYSTLIFTVELVKIKTE